MKLSEEIGQQTLVAMLNTMFISKNKNLCNSGHSFLCLILMCDLHHAILFEFDIVVKKKELI